MAGAKPGSGSTARLTRRHTRFRSSTWSTRSASRVCSVSARAHQNSSAYSPTTEPIAKNLMASTSLAATCAGTCCARPVNRSAMPPPMITSCRPCDAASSTARCTGAAAPTLRYERLESNMSPMMVNLCINARGTRINGTAGEHRGARAHTEQQAHSSARRSRAASHRRRLYSTLVDESSRRALATSCGTRGTDCDR